MSVAHDTTIAMLWGSKPPIVAVYADPDTDPLGSTWFSILFSDGSLDEDQHAVPACAACLLEEHPEVGRALDLALEVKGAVELDPKTGEWRPASTFDFEEL